MSAEEPSQTFILTRSEVNALTSMTTGACQSVERAAGRNNQVWILMNSLRTCFAEASYAMDPVKDQHPCRGCDRMPWEHPQGDCEAWY